MKLEQLQEITKREVIRLYGADEFDITGNAEIKLDDIIKRNNNRLINFILDKVKEEVEKKEIKESVPFTDGTTQEFETGLVDLEDISTIIDNLKIK